MTVRRYLLKYTLAVCLLIAALVSISIVVDPSGRIRLVDRPGFNQIKIAPKPDSRQGKAVALQQCNYDMIFLGTSRTETGLDPGSPVLNGKAAYNAGLKAGSMFELRRVAEFAAKYQQPEAIVIGLDFFAFNEGFTIHDDYAESSLADSIDIWAFVRSSLSLDTLEAALVTVQWNSRGFAKRCANNGFGSMQGKVADTRAAFEEIQSRYVKNPEIYGDFHLGQNHLRDLDEVLRLYIGKGVRVYPFISPMHATHMILITELGLLPQFKEWLRDVARIVDTVNLELQPEQPAVLWDFSGYNTITTETVPTVGDTSEMRWYRDSSHYRPAVGNMLLARMFGMEEGQSLAADFGIRLSSASIETVLAEKELAAIRYEQINASEVSNSRRLAREGRN